MIPIFEQGRGKGIGHGLESFLERFDAICVEHQQNKRANAFAFIFYDFHNHEFKEILKNEGVFTQLDRLSGKDLSIFYLHTGSGHTVKKFNSEFLSKLKLKESATPPCVVFFNLGENGFKDVAVAQLDSADLIHGFHELYGVIERYIQNDISQDSVDTRSLRWIESATNITSVAMLREILRKAFEYLPF